MSKTLTTKTNATKTNATKTNNQIKVVDLFNELTACNTKVDMINAYRKYGIECTTAPTTTPNKNDLYAQFNRVNCGDLSRIQCTSKSIKLFVTETVASALETNCKYQFDSCNDGGKRTKKTTVKLTVENFASILATFVQCGVITVK